MTSGIWLGIALAALVLVAVLYVSSAQVQRLQTDQRIAADVVTN